MRLQLRVPGLRNLTFRSLQTVTYGYYAGLLAMFADDFNKANTSLSQAALTCNNAYTANMRRIIVALIPVRIFSTGHLPSRRLLIKYNLVKQYGDIVEAVRTGNVSL
jgi:hypothetical protein